MCTTVYKLCAQLRILNISGIRVGRLPQFVQSPAMVKKAWDKVIAGGYNNQFVVDMVQGDAGTSTNMNANEVIANLALEILGQPKGRYDIISPNNHSWHGILSPPRKEALLKIVSN
nr:lyase family protein [uncultured Desulfobacter sp.]